MSHNKKTVLIIKKQKIYKCGYCSKKYIHRQSASRHRKICKSNPNYSIQIIDKLEKLDKLDGLEKINKSNENETNIFINNNNISDNISEKITNKYTTYYDFNKCIERWIKQIKHDIMDNILDYCDKPITRGKNNGKICCEIYDKCPNISHSETDDITKCKYCSLSMNTWNQKYHHELDCPKKIELQKEKIKLCLDRILTRKISEQFKLFKKSLSQNYILTPNKKTIPSPLRFSVWEQFIGINTMIAKCFVCRKSQITFQNFSCGHIISEHNGGDLDINNLRPICTNCNSSMKEMNMDHYIQIYKLWGNDPINLNQKNAM